VEISLLQEAARSNRFIESHGYGGLDPFGGASMVPTCYAPHTSSRQKQLTLTTNWIGSGHANHSKAVVNTSASVDRAWAQQLAAFLIGAGNTSYFYASDTWTRTYKDPTGERSQKHDTQTLATATGSYFCKLHYSGERCV
jgi:hypothetical protein